MWLPAMKRVEDIKLDSQISNTKETTTQDLQDLINEINSKIRESKDEWTTAKLQAIKDKFSSGIESINSEAEKNRIIEETKTALEGLKFDISAPIPTIPPLMPEITPPPLMPNTELNTIPGNKIKDI